MGMFKTIKNPHTLEESDHYFIIEQAIVDIRHKQVTLKINGYPTREKVGLVPPIKTAPITIPMDNSVNLNTKAKLTTRNAYLELREWHDVAYDVLDDDGNAVLDDDGKALTETVSEPKYEWGAEDVRHDD